VSGGNILRRLMIDRMTVDAASWDAVNTIAMEAN